MKSDTILPVSQQMALAIKLAAEKHYGQYDKAGEPYILHCLAVMNNIEGDDTELKIAAVLHDIVEDTDVTPLRLRSLGFSKRVIATVGRVTKKQGQSFEEYREIVGDCPDACRVKLADLRHNTDIRRLKVLSVKDLDRMTKYNMLYVHLSGRLAKHGAASNSLAY